MDRRLMLHELLVDKFSAWSGKDESLNVHFQPPQTIRLTYPCIIYSRGNANVLYANNKKYKNKDRYTVLLIERDPDSSLRDSISEIPYSTEEPTYRADNLYHRPFTIYF